MKDNLNIHTESHLKITDITDKKKPRSILSTRIFNKKIKINKEETKTAQQDKND
jgi:hypothetical protein